MERFFVCWIDDQGNNVCVNVNAIRMVISGPSGCDLLFSETHRVHIDGVGAAAMMNRILERATVLNGEPLHPVDLPTTPSTPTN
jgi:hypothetical protein